MIFMDENYKGSELNPLIANDETVLSYKKNSPCVSEQKAFVKNLVS